MDRRPDAATKRFRNLPSIALVSALVLLLAGILLAVEGEQLYQEQKAQEASVQAQILAASVTAALVFDDDAATQDYVAALAVNPELRVAGVYDAGRQLVGGFSRQGWSIPADPGSVRQPHLDGSDLVVVVPVLHGGDEIGSVLLRTSIDPLVRRIRRYGGIALLALMGALLVVVLAYSQEAMSRAHGVLAAQARDLSAANRNLKQQIEERERAEQALRQSQKMEALGQLTGGVAHDFNNLLQSMTGCLALVRRRVDDARIHTILDAGQQAVERGAKLTQQLLAFARRQALRPETIDVGSQLSGMAELLTRALRADMTLTLDLAPDLWPVEVDPTQFELAILNLAVNARDAMPAAGLLRLAAHNTTLPSADPGQSRLRGDFVRISISDTGDGMPAEVAARAFEPFFTTKEVGKGSGLGLSQVYGFVRQSGGAAHIDSRIGEGTTIILYLPRSHKQPTVTGPRSAPAVSGGQGRILLVEDDPTVGSLLSAMLQDFGYHVTMVVTADEGLRLVTAGMELDLLLSDVIMPGRISGVDLAREVRRQRPDLPILLMTGYSEQIAAGTEFAVLSKPYTVETLVHALESAGMSLHHERKQAGS